MFFVETAESQQSEAVEETPASWWGGILRWFHKVSAFLQGDILAKLATV